MFWCFGEMMPIFLKRGMHTLCSRDFGFQNEETEKYQEKKCLLKITANAH